jgi:hypothetical protein
VRFESRQRFASDADAVNDAYADPGLYPTLVGLPKLGGIEVVHHERSGDRVTMRIRVAFTGDLPAAVTAVVDPRKLTWVQESVHDLASATTTFQMVPDHYADRLRSSGSFVVRPAPSGTGSTRTMSGEVKVQALLVGGRVEQAIVSGLAEYLEAEAPAVDRYLAGE